MRLRTLSILLVPLLGLLVGGALWLSGRTGEPPDRFQVQERPFEKWTPLLGRLEAANPVTLRAQLDGLSKIIWIIEEGTPVDAGDVVARFDPSDLEEKRRTFSRDLEIAEAETRSLTRAKHPLELQRLISELRSLQTELTEEEALREDTRELVREDLLSEKDLLLHETRVSELSDGIHALESQIQLTRDILHPALGQIADARLRAAKTALERVEDRLNKTTVTAPVSGTVHLPSIPLDGERRAIRVGDGLYQNQVYMQIANLTDLIIQTDISEHLLSRIVPGLPARVRIPAFPRTPFEASIVRVGSQPTEQNRRYPVILDLQNPGPALRPGLTAEIEVLEYQLEDAIVIPREWLAYQGSQPAVKIQDPSGKHEVRPVTLRDGDAGHVHVSEGLSVGDILLKP
ncbi:MAG: efflux RND transporter periplasmic adaptor subunit [Kiritimatiellia bacterium]